MNDVIIVTWVNRHPEEEVRFPRMGIEQENAGPGFDVLEILDMDVGRQIRALSFAPANPLVRHTVLAAGEAPILLQIGEERMDTIRETKRLPQHLDFLGFLLPKPRLVQNYLRIEIHVIERLKLEPIYPGVLQRPGLSRLVNLIVNPVDRNRWIVGPGHRQ